MWHKLQDALTEQPETGACLCIQISKSSWLLLQLLLLDFVLNILGRHILNSIASAWMRLQLAAAPGVWALPA